MRKIFLVLAVTGVYDTASAQQNDLFDAQKHLQKKAKQHKKISGKAAFTFTNHLFISGQRLPLGKRSPILANGNRVFILPVDNMPCVSPDMTRFHNMPNADDRIRQFISDQRRSGQIPNPAHL